MCSSAVAARAGTTGGIQGRVTDRTSGAPLAGVTVALSSPSQSATNVSDAAGGYRFLSLAPDSYTLTFTKSGYDPVSQAGFSVFADQTQSLSISMNKSLQEIGRVTSRSSNDLVKAGTTSDVYSINAAGAEAAAALGGSGGLNSAYSAIASVPGANVAQGQQGWYQTVSIRGGDIDQVGYELDGIPVNRAYDNAPQTMLSGLGQQELQVYTGGTPASADASGIAGYINQVIRTGTFPGYATVNAALGSPAFYHKLSAEAGGSTPSRNFSYYIGLAGVTQDYRYLDSSNGAGDPRFFYPLDVGGVTTVAGCPSGFTASALNNAGPCYQLPYNGPGSYAAFSNGNAYAIANTNQRDTVANVHFQIPHRQGSIKDDIQLLWLTSEINLGYYSSINDLGGPTAINNDPFQGAPPVFQDHYVYAGQLFAPFDPNAVSQYFFPSTSHQRAFRNSNLPLNARDTNDNGVGIVKAQYQKNFNESSYARIYLYSLYSNWFIYGPVSAALDYSAEIGDYEIPNHTVGANLSYANQINAKNLLSASVSYTTSNTQRLSGTGFPGNILSFTNPNGNGTCFDPASGLPASCFGAGTPSAYNPFPTGGGPVLPATPDCTANPGLPACVANAKFLVTSTGYKANLNQVHPKFTAVSVSDLWRPNDRVTVNAGLRVENYSFDLGSTTGPARPFWFNAYNNEYCVGPAGAFNNFGGPACNVAFPGTTQAHLVNESGGTLSSTVVQPRFGMTYQASPYTVYRASFGVYARPENSSWVQYNTVQQDLPSFLGSNFASYGFTSPRHNIRPDVSYNYDLSLERSIRGTDWSFKLSPFYRSTKDQLQNFFINPQNGLESGLNVGRQKSYGVELALRKGDFSRDGFSGQLSYTYTNSKIKYGNFSGSSTNIIDLLNNYITQYNAYTAMPAFVKGTDGQAVANPYAGKPAQPLFDRNGDYTTYDVIPAPYAAGNGYETPHVLSLILNYRKNKFNISPSMTYSSGASYGSPLSWPGYVPDQCTNNSATAGAPLLAPPQGCSNFTSSGSFFFIPDVYTGKFDNLGAFKQPSRITMNLSMGYDISDKVKANLILTGLVDSCKQRGYAWDDSNICVYSTFPSGILSPVGNFAGPGLPNANPNVPVQLAYPYSYWSNINNTGFVGVKLPFQAVFSLKFKI
ncbi:MAG: carboxypeptidase regulatory-like domain-containing protein [Candidatus Eremiobacteraeota bacterium]|nr:carboxypeptidase regulatory-like domain-containing protein [Candidatus Eremiobacteraeota bacterium]